MSDISEQASACVTAKLVLHLCKHSYYGFRIRIAFSTVYLWYKLPDSSAVEMAPVPEETKSVFLGYGSLVGALVAAHLVVVFFWFYQLAKGTPPSAETKKQQ